MSPAPRNLAASVKARLLALAQTRGDDFNRLLVRYGIERLLFRLSRSPHAGQFLLKGAMLFVVWDEETHRPTRDLDLLGFGAAERELLQQVFREVVTTPAVDDGLAFDPGSVRAEEIREQSRYGGVRVRLIARLGPAEIPLQIDVGVGDAVFPEPEEVVFPALLEFPPPRVRAYPVYAVVAEKLETMVKLGGANTRMKDFHDVWFLLHRFALDRATSRRAIEVTFARRGTRLEEWSAMLAATLADDPGKQTQWNSFLSRNSLQGLPERFNEVVDSIREDLKPVLGT